MVLLSAVGILLIGVASKYIYPEFYDNLKCINSECCHLRMSMNSNFMKHGISHPWLYYDTKLTQLEYELKARVHGQNHIVKPIVSALRAHLSNENPSKALVMSFNGWTGTGKNYASEIIAKNLFRLGRNSQYFKLIAVTHYFPLHNVKSEGVLEQYRQKLSKLVQEESSMCDRNLFIIDEVDKLPSGVIDVIRPYVDYHEHISNVNYRKNIFIFLSNTGGKKLNLQAHDMYMKGKRREDMSSAEIDQLISLGSFNEAGGLMRSTLLEQNLVDVFVPFLPLERQHVNKCIRDYMEKMNYKIDDLGKLDKFVDQVADTLSYWPPEQEIYSRSGCKRVSSKVDLNFAIYNETLKKQ